MFLLTAFVEYGDIDSAIQMHAANQVSRCLEAAWKLPGSCLEAVQLDLAWPASTRRAH
jgi:hypothetical protein